MGLIDDVREEVCAIPPGQVWSYGDIGEVLHISARQVGRVMGILDDDDAVPWWRVVRADGTPATCHEARRLSFWPKKARRCAVAGST